MESLELKPKRNSGRNGGRKCKIPFDNPELLDKILENRALGLSWRLIAESLGENENTVRGWLQRKDFNQKLAAKKLEILQPVLKDFADRAPKEFIERHKETREDFSPPNQKIDLRVIQSINDLTDEERASLLEDLRKRIECVTDT